MNILTIINVFLAIACGKRKAIRRTRIICAFLISTITVGILIATFAFNGFMWSTTLYSLFSITKHFAEFCGESTNWDMLSSVLYEFGRIGKDWLISNSGVAAFLDACNVNIFGKVVQILLLTVGTTLCIWVCSVAWRSLSTLFSSLLETYLVNHRNCRLYTYMLNDYIHTYRVKDYSSNDMKKSRWYKLFAKERDVQRLLQIKLNREGKISKKRNNTIDFQQEHRRRHG